MVGSAVAIAVSCVLSVVPAANAVDRPAGSPAEAASALAPPGITAIPARTLDGRKVDSAAAAQRAANYWTPERMRSATPAEVPQVTSQQRAGRQARPGSPGSKPMVLDKQGARTLAAATREAGGGLHAATTVSAIGKVFFVDPTLGNRQRYCSGSLLLSYKSKLLLTAGHCVFHDGVPMLQVTFAPDYPGNQTRFAVTYAVMPTRWAPDGVSGYDYSISVLAEPIGLTYGGNPLVYNAPTSGLLVDAFGFPGGADGTFLMLCTGFTGGQALHQVGLPGCTPNVLGEGASGGPWVVQSNGVEGYVNGVNANYYPYDPSTLYSPYFDDLTADIWIYAETVLS
jgi:hypothetical protein